MTSSLKILPLQDKDINQITQWSRNEGFAPGVGDVGIYQHTDRQGLWVGWLDGIAIGCIAGVRYNPSYGFIGLFLVVKEKRGRGYGLQLWNHALDHLIDLPCIGLEAALDRVDDYAGWGFQASSTTSRWKYIGNGYIDSNIAHRNIDFDGLSILEGSNIPSEVVQSYDAKREPSPRPHFLSDWLEHSAGKVLALVDEQCLCHGFGRIRPCLLQDGEGWRIGPLLADSPALAEILLRRLVADHPGVVLIDSPGKNNFAEPLLRSLGFTEISQTLRMYRGSQPPISMKDVYGLACLELG